MSQQEHNGIGDELVGSLQVLYSTMGGVIITHTENIVYFGRHC